MESTLTEPTKRELGAAAKYAIRKAAATDYTSYVAAIQKQLARQLTAHEVDYAESLVPLLARKESRRQRAEGGARLPKFLEDTMAYDRHDASVERDLRDDGRAPSARRGRGATRPRSKSPRRRSRSTAQARLRRAGKKILRFFTKFALAHSEAKDAADDAALKLDLENVAKSEAPLLALGAFARAPTPLEQERAIEAFLDALRDGANASSARRTSTGPRIAEFLRKSNAYFLKKAREA
jgi:hypothetical protein